MSESPPSEQPPQTGDGGAGPDSGGPGRWRLPLVRLGQGPLTRRIVGVPWLFAVAYAAVGFSLYFSIGVVADRGLGLTPLIFLAAGLLFVLATLSYLEGGAMFLERGGSAALARHAFNELVSFIAGWAILIDYIIVIALAAVSVPHYLSPIWGGFTHGWAEIAVTAVVIVFTAGVNIAGFTGQVRQRLEDVPGGRGREQVHVRGQQIGVEDDDGPDRDHGQLQDDVGQRQHDQRALANPPGEAGDVDARREHDHHGRHCDLRPPVREAAPDRAQVVRH